MLYIEPTTQKYTVVSVCVPLHQKLWCGKTATYFQLFGVPGMYTWAHIATESMYYLDVSPQPNQNKV